MEQKTVETLKRIVVIWACAAAILILIGIKMREYKREFLFERHLLTKLSDIEKKQDEILRQISQQKINAARPAADIPQRPPMPDPNKIYSISVGQSPVKGEASAKITIVEFSDIQCPFSKKFHSIFMNAVAGHSKDVKFIFKNFPLSFHDQAKPAVKALLAAKEQGKYWEMLDLLFANAESLSDAKYKELAASLKLDIARFEKDLKEKDAQWEKIIEADIEEGKKAEVMGTPTFYLNGKRTEARTAEDLKKEIDQLLKK